jgi:sigma-B regulation protein RsbU (phosphoserine phosphatase)
MRAARILVVDDEPGIVRAVDRVLGATHQVSGTSSSRAALSYAEQMNPDLAILDIRMPDLDGFELMTQLKARFPDLDVILMTGSIEDLDEKLVRALRSPAFYFIQKPFDRDVLCTLVERCLELRWRREDHQRNLNRLEMEMAEARAFQQSLLPEREAILNGLSICCRYLPSVQLGGDLYDYVDAGSGSTALLIADVSGHGVSAAMLTGVVKSAFRASIADGYDPYAVVRRVWGGLSAFRPDRFVTLFTALVSLRERRLAYVNAGHPSVLLWNVAGKLKWLESGGPLVSPALPASTWDVQTVPIEDGDQLLLYTDGVSEVFADTSDGAQTRIELLVERHGRHGAQLLDGILGAVRDGLAGAQQPDDLTLLTARVLEDGPAEALATTS